MAITNHVACGHGADFETRVELNGRWNECTQSADSDGSNLVLTVTGDTVDAAVIGTYHVNYVSNDDTQGYEDTHTIIETVVVYTNTPSREDGIQDFIDGGTDRYGHSTQGTGYEAALNSAVPKPLYASMFDENALDPYEKKEATINK